MAERRTTVAVVAAAVVVIGVIGVVLAFGIRRVPTFPPVSADPPLGAPGSIAFLSDADDPCVRVVAASGGPARTLHCVSPEAGLVLFHAVAWSRDGDVVVGGSSDLGDEVVLVLDPSSGEVVDRIVRAPGGRAPEQWSDPQAARTRDDGAQLVMGGDDGSSRVAVRDPQGDTRTIVSVEGPRDYRVVDAQWSPNGEWVLLVDGEGRLLLIDAQGETGPRLLADGVEARGMAVAWFVPGSVEGTVDPTTAP